MITSVNQTKIYKNEVVRDAIRLIRKGESAFIYSELDVQSLIKIVGLDNLTIIKLEAEEAFRMFEYHGILYIVSYSEAILKTMAYAIEKIYILSDMGFRLSNPDKKYIKDSISCSEVERRFWKLYDKYSEEV